jgi:hypothetical protein
MISELHWDDDPKNVEMIGMIVFSKFGYPGITLRLTSHGARASRAGSKVFLKPDVIRLADPLGHYVNSPDHSDQSAPVATNDSWGRSSPMDRAKGSHLDGFYS